MAAEIIIVGVGPGRAELLTLEAKKILEESKRVFFRYGTHPVARTLIQAGKDVVSFERLYANPAFTYGDVYRLIVKTIIKEAKRESRAVLALPGNAYVFEKTPRWIEDAIKKDGEDINVRVITGMSFLELMYPFLGIDPEEGLTILNAARIVEDPDRYAPNGRVACLIGQLGLPVGSKPTGGEVNIEKLLGILLKIYTPKHNAVIVRCKGFPSYQTEKIETTVGEIDRHKAFINNLTSLYLPAMPR